MKQVILVFLYFTACIFNLFWYSTKVLMELSVIFLNGKIVNVYDVN